MSVANCKCQRRLIWSLLPAAKQKGASALIANISVSALFFPTIRHTRRRVARQVVWSLRQYKDRQRSEQTGWGSESGCKSTSNVFMELQRCMDVTFSFSRSISLSSSAVLLQNYRASCCASLISSLCFFFFLSLSPFKCINIVNIKQNE